VRGRQHGCRGVQAGKRFEEQTGERWCRNKINAMNMPPQHSKLIHLVGVPGRESAKMLEVEEHPEDDGYLHERHQQYGQHAHVQLLVHLALFECDTLHSELVPGLVCLLEFNQTRLVRCKRGGVADLLDRERGVAGARRAHPR